MSNYKQKEVTFENKLANITLAGTLTVPCGTGPFPAVILIAGMGPNNRDYAFFDTGHNMFAYLADYLARHGIATLRYDKRGVGKSTGTFDMLQTTSGELATDVHAGIEYLKTRQEVDAHRIGLIGHSEGGLIASLLAHQSSDIAHAILLAAPIATRHADVVEHAALQLQAEGATADLIARDRVIRAQLLLMVSKENNPERAAQQMYAVFERYWRELPDERKAEAERIGSADLMRVGLLPINATKIHATIATMNSPWSRYYLSYDPIETFKHITMPVMAINGDIDFTAHATIVLPIIEHAFQQTNNPLYKLVTAPAVNHWMQRGATGTCTEYGSAQETMAPAVLQSIADWVMKNRK